MSNQPRLPKATIAESLGVFMDVVVPNVAKGPIIRRPKVVGMAERMDLERRAVRRLQKLRDRYRTGPVMLRLPVRDQAVVLSPMSARETCSASGTASRARLGISACSESDGACTTATRPHRRMASRPAAPSSSMPLRITPMTRLRQWTAAERNSTSMAGRLRFSRGPYTTRIPRSPKTRCRSGGATLIRPGSSGSPSRAITAGRAPARPRIRLSAPGDSAAWCCTTRTAAGRSGAARGPGRRAPPGRPWRPR
jgi:hypothetical protein